MSTNVLFFGWNRPVPGREASAGEQFQEFVQYLVGKQQAGDIASFEPVFLNAHGGDLNGFFLIQGEPAQLDALQSSEEWITHMMRAGLHLEGQGVVRGVTGELLMERMGKYTSLISE